MELQSFDLELLNEVIDALMTNQHPKFYELMQAMGGWDMDYDPKIKQIFMSGRAMTDLNYDELRTYLTFILRAEKFSEGTIVHHMKNLDLLKLCLRLQDLVYKSLSITNHRTYSFDYIKSKKHYSFNGFTHFKVPLDQNYQWTFDVVYKDSGEFDHFEIECKEEDIVCRFENENVIRARKPFCHYPNGYRLLLHDLIALYDKKYLRDLVREIQLRNRMRYYRLESGLIVKINEELMDSYVYDERTDTWHRDVTYFVKKTKDELHHYEEVKMQPIKRMGPALIIGRNPTCDLVLNFHYVSSEHALIIKDGDHYKIKDLGSLNGVLVNGNKVKEKILEYGDKIGIGLQNIYFFGDHLDIIQNDLSKEIYLV